MTHYDNTKEDSRSWRGYQDTAGQAIDDAAKAKAVAVTSRTAKLANENGIIVTPATSTGATGSTVQLTAKAVGTLAGNVTWKSSDITKVTVNASGLATRVAVGSATITASSKGSGQVATPEVSGKARVTVA